MFDSLEGAYLPICLAVILSAWFLAGIKSVWRRVFMALVIPITISFLWYVVSDFFRSVPEKRDPAWLNWGLAATMVWSIAAIPVSIVSVYIFVLVRKRAESTTKGHQ
ncbi:hypothetical protein FO488_06650 [Geobacter sp. FeAm09]|uniref:hypothetical protein n=1 Tax=Geobacter sp. FeAm09 TaxID=2597769 RepID=UPI0011EC0073|nr:hypothetical protein [Geobacter sp. FeAm09]QEM67867.1 hypothetical protein FO488_06650 [Geobacter sp. FeAm09]